MASISFFTNLGGLEEDFNEAMELLNAAFFSMEQCLSTFGDTSRMETAKDLCERTIAGIHSHMRSAMNLIEEAFWALNSACATELRHEDFLITELDQIKKRLETESTGSKIAWYSKRAVGLITMAIVGAIGLIAAIPITLAVENRAQQIQLDSLHNTIGTHHEAIKFIEDAIAPI